VIDDQPLQVVTHLDLDVADRVREVLLGPVLLDGLIPLRIESSLPARLEADGRLRLQVRAGRWVVELAARSSEGLGAIAAPWPPAEVWVFDARDALRLVEIERIPSLDSRQTRLPAARQNLPAYRMLPGESFRMHVVPRGDPQPEPDRLSLERDLWLDFAGDGYSIHDRIRGSLTRNWRLETQPELELGHVLADGKPQLITQLADSDRPGVEVRRGALDVRADSRYAGNLGSLPASG
jgi:hypothetical protein